MVSTHIYGVSKEMDGKMFIFRVNLGMWPLKLIILEKRGLFWEFQHTFMVSKEIDGKTFIFQVNLVMWPLKLIIFEKWSPVLMVSAHIYDVSKEIDGKTLIFQVNLDPSCDPNTNQGDRSSFQKQTSNVIWQR